MASPEDDLPKKVKDLKIKDEIFINILLLGETGVGKSTFINSIANYLTYNDFKKAQNDNLVTLIPSKCKIKDKHGEQHLIQIGSEDDQNECLDTGMSATQDVKSYVFPTWNGSIKIRLIDTPGIGDCRGVDQDNINCNNILSHIGQFHELHAICYLFKPTNPRITVYFEYCMTQILSRLDKSASQNIIFIFTNTRGTDYGPGDTFTSLQKVIEDIQARQPNVNIPLKKNVFCLDNESFRYLAAVKQNVEFEDSVKERNRESWQKSVQQCNNLIKYITGDKNNPPLKPHSVKNTSAINEARRLIVQLSQRLAETTRLINDNIYVLQRHQESLDLVSDSLDQLRQKLYMPIVDLEITKLPHPVTVCASRKCAEVYKVGDIYKWHYKQKCHEPCYCLTNAPKEIIGCPELANCAAINSSTRTCIKCDCDFSTHMHVYYLSKTTEGKIVDNNIKKNIEDKEKLFDNVRGLITEISTKKGELEEEHKVIRRTCAKFSHFLHNNAITPFSDSYKEYIDYLIVRERSLGVLPKMSKIHRLQTLLQEFEEAKQTFNQALSLQKRIGEEDMTITLQEIEVSIQELFNLKHNGKKIEELYESQKKSLSKEHKYSEYVHEMLTELKQDRTTNEKKGFNKNANKIAFPQKKQQQQSHWRGNQRENNSRQWERNRSQSRLRERNSSPPPAYQDIHPPRREGRYPSHNSSNHIQNYGRQYSDSGHSGPYYNPHEYSQHPPKPNYYPPHPTRPNDYPQQPLRPNDYPPHPSRPNDYASRPTRPNDYPPHPSRPNDYASRSPRPNDYPPHPPGDNRRYYDPRGYPEYQNYRDAPPRRPGPDHREGQYEAYEYDPRNDRRDREFQRRNSIGNECYEVKFVVNKSQRSPQDPPRNVPSPGGPLPGGPPSGGPPPGLPPPPPPSTFQQPYYPPPPSTYLPPPPHYGNHQHSVDPHASGYYNNRRPQDPDRQERQNRPSERNYNPQNRGRGGFRGRGGRGGLRNDPQKFKKISDKKKSSKARSSSDSDSD